MKARWVLHNPSPEMPMIGYTIVAKWWPGRYYLAMTFKRDLSVPLARLTRSIEQGIPYNDVVPGPDKFMTQAFRCNKDGAVASFDTPLYEREYSDLSAARGGHELAVETLQQGLPWPPKSSHAPPLPVTKPAFKVPASRPVLEKSEPGTERAPTKRVLSVLVAGSLDSYFGEMFALLVPQMIDERLSVKVEHYEQAGALLKTLEHHKFDLAFVYLHLFSPPSSAKGQQSTDTRDILRRVGQLPENAWITCEGLVAIELLRRVHGIPVVALTGSGYGGAEMVVKQAGASALFSLPFDLHPFVECLRGIIGP